jgi:hypothetical protein
MGRGRGGDSSKKSRLSWGCSSTEKARSTCVKMNRGCRESSKPQIMDSYAAKEHSGE